MRLSPSQITTFRRCSLQYYFAYIAKIKMKPTGKMLQGRAVDAGVSMEFNEKMTSGALPPVSAVMDATAEAFEREQQLTLFEADEKPGELKDQAVGLSRLHWKEIAPAVEPMFVQHWMSAEVGGHEVRMVADVIDQDLRVIDTKTSGRRIDEESLRTDAQLAGYTLGAERTLGSPVTAIRLDRLLTTKKPDFQQIEVKRADVDTQRFRHVTTAVAQHIEQGLFVPVDDMKVCSWCGFRPICHGAKWWDYLKDPGLAKDAARTVLAHAVLPEGAVSIPTPETKVSV